MSTEIAQTIEEAASAWLIHRDSGAWTSADEKRLQEWLEASSLHRVAFWRLEMAWGEAARLKALGAGIVGNRPPPRGEWNLTPFFESREPVRRPRRWLSAAAFGTAATLLLAAAGVAYYWLQSSEDRYATPIGAIAAVSLQDGSNMNLNTATQVQVDLTNKERDIELTRGEVFFEVAKDAKRPFVVNAGKKRVIAVGTQFSVLREGGDIRVIVSEGTVRIENRPGSGSAPAVPLSSAAAVQVSAGSIVHAGDAGVLVQQKSLSETQEQLSWRTGMLMFRDQTLAQAVAEFNRYNKRQIVIRDPAVADLKIEGNFRATNVHAFIRLLESGMPVRASESGDEI